MEGTIINVRCDKAELHNGNPCTREVVEHNGGVYICLAPAEEVEDIEEDELVIMRIKQDAEGNDFYTTIESEKELQEVFEKYLEIAEADEDEEGEE